MKKEETYPLLENISSEKQQELYQYWLDLKGENLMPSRKLFNPVDIPRVLSSLYLVDVFYDPLRFQVRLAGTQNVQKLGFDPKGYSSDGSPAIKGLIERFEWAVRNKKPYCRVEKMLWGKKDYVEYSALVLPMSDNNEDVNLFIASVDYF